MRKISKGRNARAAAMPQLPGDRPSRIEGATITTWPGRAKLDMTALFTAAAARTTVTGTEATPVSAKPQPASTTVSLSDGTRITFSNVNESMLDQA